MLIGLKSPGLYLQGANILRELYKYVGEFGKKALIILSPSGMQRHGEALLSGLKTSDFLCRFEETKAECCRAEIDRIAAEARADLPDMVIGVGGGKILDIAKAAAHTLHLPCVIIPTVASTDAPCSSMSVLYTPDGVFEGYSFLDRGPDVVLVDTDIIMHTPASLFSAGMGDAMSTYFEARAVNRSGSPNQIRMRPTAAAYALGKCCHEILLEYGEAALNCIKNQEPGMALERVVEANTYLSGVGFESGGVAAAHALSKGMTAVPALHKKAHGEAVAFCTLVQLCLEHADNAELNELLSFLHMASLPTTFADLTSEPVSEAEWMAAAEFTCRPGMTIHKMPFEVTPQMLLEAIYRADEIGRAGAYL